LEFWILLVRIQTGPYIHEHIRKLWSYILQFHVDLDVQTKVHLDLVTKSRPSFLNIQKWHVYLINKNSNNDLIKDTIKTNHMTGLMDKAIAKANKNEFDRYEKHYNTAYSVSKNNQLFSHCTLLSEIQIKNGLRMGSSI